MNYRIMGNLGRFILVVLFSIISISALSIWLKIIFSIVLLVIYYKIDNILDKKQEQRLHNDYTFLNGLETGELVRIQLKNGDQIGPAIFLMNHYKLGSLSVTPAPYYNYPVRVHELGKMKKVKFRKIDSIEFIDWELAK
ncbi:hypothetical protein ABE042_09125 [Viridibacillus arvi]|uniref:hypothetical protein n=1 Tax=Viridibacillus arvi TaxID=263475 RepID=UPI003D2AEC78